MLQILFAFFAGVLTVGAPCILPVLPIILGASVGREQKFRPIYIVAGFVLSFTVAALLFSAVVHQTGLSALTLRHVGIAFLILFGVLLSAPTLFEKIVSGATPLIGSVMQKVQGRTGNGGAFLIGVTLGIVWAPCAGPALGAILALVATSASVAAAAIPLLAYAAGAGVPMLLIAYGGQFVTTRVRVLAPHTATIQKIFGVLVILLGVAMYFNYDVFLQAKLLDLFSPAASSLQAAPIQLQNLGAAPEFGSGTWLNSSPLTLKSLHGKVVLVDFWTYSCINCIRTLPYVTSWYDKYKADGLVVVGVHTPEFAFEKETANVQRAIAQFNIHYPVLQDNDYATWQNFQNEYWPAEYLIDQNGNVVHTNFGEGEYAQTENAIRQLLGLGVATTTPAAENLSGIGSPEMYFGNARRENLVASQTASDVGATYLLPQQVPLNFFALRGAWKFDDEKMTSQSAGAQIMLHFHAAKLHFVAASASVPVTLHIIVDGVPQPDVVVRASQLYTLFDSSQYTDHTAVITTDVGLQAFTFTFG